jgi:flagellin
MVNGSAPTNDIRSVLGVASNKLKTDASITLSVAGKDYNFANGETVGDMVSYINGAQNDYELTIDRDHGLTATRTKIGDGGTVNDLSFRVYDVAGNAGAMTGLSSTAYQFSGDLADAAASGTGGIDYGVNIQAHLEGAGLPGGNVYLTSTGDDASLLKNNAYGINVQTATAFAKTAGTVTANMTKAAIFQVGPNNGQLVGVDIKDVQAFRLGLGGDQTGALRSLADLSNKQSLVNGMFTESLAVIDKAIDDITTLRGGLGSFQANSLETGLNSLRATNENLSAAESTIRDTDFAKESSAFSKNQILVQSSTAMLAQANQLGQNVMQLLGR